MRLKEWSFKFCPFCKGFGFSRQKGRTFRCWGCGAEGNHIVFMAMTEGIEIIDLEEALKDLKRMREATAPDSEQR
jgi:hypothetical protein